MPIPFSNVIFLTLVNLNSILTHPDTRGLDSDSLCQQLYIISYQIRLPFKRSFPALSPYSARRSCAVVSSSAAVQNKSILDRIRYYNRCWNVRCRNMESMMGWFLCGWVEDLCSSRNKATMVGWWHWGTLWEKRIRRTLKLIRFYILVMKAWNLLAWWRR